MATKPAVLAALTVALAAAPAGAKNLFGFLRSKSPSSTTGRSQSATLQQQLGWKGLAFAHVMGAQVLPGQKQVSVTLRLFARVRPEDMARGQQQPRAEQTLVIPVGQEVLLGTGNRDKSTVSIKADRLGRVSTRYFSEGWGRPEYLGEIHGVEIRRTEAQGNTLLLQGRLWQTISGGVDFKPRDLRGYTVQGGSLVKQGRAGKSLTITDAWKSISGKSVRAHGMDFTARIGADDKERVIDLGRMRNGWGSAMRVKVHVVGGNIRGLSEIFQSSKPAAVAAQ